MAPGDLAGSPGSQASRSGSGRTPQVGNDAFAAHCLQGVVNSHSGHGVRGSASAPAAGPPGELLPTQRDAPSRKSSLANGSGTPVPALGLLGLLALVAPELFCRVRFRHDLAVMPPVVILLDHPG
jgi:hypothetical protein